VRYTLRVEGSSPPSTLVFTAPAEAHVAEEAVDPARLRRADDGVVTPRRVVLVEGHSDRAALQALARRRGLAAAGLRDALVPDGLASLGFFACRSDLEDELIRAHGVAGVEDLIESAGEAWSLRLLAGMPAQRDRTRDAVLKRFLGVRSGRKARYASLLVEALEPEQVPAPLVAALAVATCHEPHDC
jgi:hypothetical protein